MSKTWIVTRKALAFVLAAYALVVVVRASQFSCDKLAGHSADVCRSSETSYRIGGWVGALIPMALAYLAYPRARKVRPAAGQPALQSQQNPYAPPATEVSE